MLRQKRRSEPAPVVLAGVELPTGYDDQKSDYFVPAELRRPSQMRV